MLDQFSHRLLRLQERSGRLRSPPRDHDERLTLDRRVHKRSAHFARLRGMYASGRRKVRSTADHQQWFKQASDDKKRQVPASDQTCHEQPRQLPCREHGDDNQHKEWHIRLAHFRQSDRRNRRTWAVTNAAAASICRIQLEKHEREALTGRMGAREVLY